MEEGKRQLIGSETRDLFRWGHKQIFPPNCYASDMDLPLISPEEVSIPDTMLALLSKGGILAIIDYKTILDTITWAEEIFYDDLDSKGYLIYIVRGYIHTILNNESIFEVIKMSFPQYSVSSRNEIVEIFREDFHKLKVFQYTKENNKIIEELKSTDFISWELEMRKKQNGIIKYRNEHYGRIKSEKKVRVECANCGFIFDVPESEFDSSVIICRKCGSNACSEFEEYREFKEECEKRKRWEEEEIRRYLEDREI